MKVTENLKVLFERVRSLSESEENRKILSRWTGAEVRNDVSVTEGASVWHGIPLGKAGEVEDIPFTVDPEIAFWSRALKFDMKEYYTDPACYLENHLKMKLFRYENFGDDSVITTNISIFIGVTLEPSMYGVKTIYTSDYDPWNSLDKYVVEDEEDLRKLCVPDFYKSGLMPLAHKFYEEIGSALPEGFTLNFPMWGRGPFGVAQHLMGMQNLAVNIIENPEFVRDLLGFITECNINWLKERAKFLCTGIGKGVLYNDEVNCQVISPDTYRDLIFPFEQKLAVFQDGLTYWHSCGKTSPILKYIKQLKGLELYDSSAWSDINTSVSELAGSNTAIEVRMNPVSDVMFAGEDHIRQKLEGILKRCKDLPITVRADGMQVMRSVEEDIESIKRWSRIAKEVLRQSESQD